jgi:hypothetical protein
MNKWMIGGLAISALTMMGSAAIAQQDAAAPTEEAAAKPKKITDRNHPDYVRCRNEEIIGTRARKNRVCMTNRQWAEVARGGNEMTEEFIRSHRSGLSGS